MLVQRFYCEQNHTKSNEIDDRLSSCKIAGLSHLAVIANTLVTASGFLGLTGVAAFLAIVARMVIEESERINRFGRDYLEYMQHTGRFLPRIRREQS